MKRLWGRFQTKEPPYEERHEVSRHSILVLERVLRETVTLLKSYHGARGPHEGIVYWAGLPFESLCIVTTCIAPRAKTTGGSFSTTTKANAEVIAWINRYKLHLLGQVHSHPGDWVDHSAGDDAMAFMPYEGYLSIIVSRYGQRGMMPLTTCGVHRYHNGRFERLPDPEVKTYFHIVPERADLRRRCG